MAHVRICGSRGRATALGHPARARGGGWGGVKVRREGGHGATGERRKVADRGGRMEECGRGGRSGGFSRKRRGASRLQVEGVTAGGFVWSAGLPRSSVIWLPSWLRTATWERRGRKGARRSGWPAAPALYIPQDQAGGRDLLGVREEKEDQGNEGWRRTRGKEGGRGRVLSDQLSVHSWGGLSFGR